MNTPQTPQLHKHSVSKRFSLVQMQERTDDGIKKYWHLVDGCGVGGYEYTTCGKAYTDSNMRSEDFEYIKEKQGGKITCPLCNQHISWYKAL